MRQFNRNDEFMSFVGLLSLFIRHEFHSTVVNSLAAGTLAVYLVTTYPPVRAWLWQALSVRSLMEAWYVPCLPSSGWL